LALTGSIVRNSLSRKLQNENPEKLPHCELIAATMGSPQLSVADEPDPFTTQTVTARAFSGTLNGMKILLM
jgi:hypothetical protein